MVYRIISDRREFSETVLEKTSELLPFELKDVSSEFGNCEAKRVKSGLEAGDVMLALPFQDSMDDRNKKSRFRWSSNA